MRTNFFCHAPLYKEYCDLCACMQSAAALITAAAHCPAAVKRYFLD